MEKKIIVKFHGPVNSATLPLYWIFETNINRLLKIFKLLLKVYSYGKFQLVLKFAGGGEACPGGHGQGWAAPKRPILSFGPPGFCYSLVSAGQSAVANCSAGNQWQLGCSL